MKQSAILILLLTPIVLFAKPSLRISLFSFKVQTLFDTSTQVKLYKGDKLLHDITMSFWGDTTLADLDTGIYRIEFTTVFKRLVSQTVRVSNDEKYQEWLYVDTYDKTKDTFKGFISSLTEGESLMVSFEKYGCFHWETQKIKVSLSKGKYVATLFPEKLVRANKKKGPAITKTLTQKDIDRIHELEQFVFSTDSGGGGTEMTSCKFDLDGVSWLFNLGEDSRKEFDKLRDTVFRPK